MYKFYITILIVVFICFVSISFTYKPLENNYYKNYTTHLQDLVKAQQSLLEMIKGGQSNSAIDRNKIKAQIDVSRHQLKRADFWLRYLEPIVYKKINGPLPVEWETEVFEKFEKPYKREGAGLTLAALYLDEPSADRDSLTSLIQQSITAFDTYQADSITSQLNAHHHFYLCNRLYLLNLAAIYTTGFECPDTSRVIPELRSMLADVRGIYESFNESFAAYQLPTGYLDLYKNAQIFANNQPSEYSNFDHFNFIKNYINPLFTINQSLIRQYKVFSKSFNDYSLTKTSTSIFSKGLYNGQNPKGIFLRVDDEKVLAEIDALGKMLYYDPILSGNNLRSCNSCHKQTEYFTDTLNNTPSQFSNAGHLTRNAPSLINAKFNHLLMMDGKHTSLQSQLKDVMFNPIEMGSNEKEQLNKILSCSKYKKSLSLLLKYTPQETEITIDHVISSITFYYSKFSNYYAPFDEAMNEGKAYDEEAKQGFNIFMSKAQCGTCHFVPNFNGVKPPYVGSEFEVLGVPADKQYSQLSSDKGRYEMNNAVETMNALRTGSIRNAAYTKPYMHNGVFTSLDEVIEFYNNGGGVGHGLNVPNQTLSSDSLHLSAKEKYLLVKFIESLTERIKFETPPASLPPSSIAKLNKRIVGGVY